MKTVKVIIKSRSVLPPFSDEELTTLATRIGLTLDQLQRLGEAVYRTYGAIGADLSQANDGKLMKRRDVIEVVLDAGHLETFGRLEPDLKLWRSASFTRPGTLDDYYGAIAAVAFPHSEYE